MPKTLEDYLPFIRKKKYLYSPNTPQLCGGSGIHILLV